jgi:hypothetical protein
VPWVIAALVSIEHSLIQGKKIRLLKVEKYFDIVIYAFETISAKDEMHPELLSRIRET